MPIQVSGNVIHHLGLYTKQACAVFSAVSCQNLIEDNVFFHGPRAVSYDAACCTRWPCPLIGT